MQGDVKKPAQNEQEMRGTFRVPIFVSNMRNPCKLILGNPLNVMYTK